MGGFDCAENRVWRSTLRHACRKERAKEAAMAGVTATVNYLGAMTERPRYYAQDHGRDNLVLERNN